VHVLHWKGYFQSSKIIVTVSAGYGKNKSDYDAMALTGSAGIIAPGLQRLGAITEGGGHHTKGKMKMNLDGLSILGQ